MPEPFDETDFIGEISKIKAKHKFRGVERFFGGLVKVNTLDASSSILITEAGNNFVLIPSVDRFASSQDSSHFTEWYETEGKKIGSLTIKKPAVIGKNGRLISKGVISVQ